MGATSNSKSQIYLLDTWAYQTMTETASRFPDIVEAYRNIHWEDAMNKLQRRQDYHRVTLTDGLSYWNCHCYRRVDGSASVGLKYSNKALNPVHPLVQQGFAVPRPGHMHNEAPPEDWNEGCRRLPQRIQPTNAVFAVLVLLGASGMARKLLE